MMQKKFRKIYLEISNICNLRCSFCPGTSRPPQILDEREFTALLQKLRPWTDFLYFHLMGEPLLHPHLQRYLELAGQIGFKVILTTNGTLLKDKQELLLSSPGLHKINISLHAFEANDLSTSMEEYLRNCFQFGKAAESRKLTVFRLWNQGGQNARNEEILQIMREYFPDEWVTEPRGTRMGNRVYLEYGDKFDWPDLNAPENSERIFCYGLRDQLGVLCDGTVVPCCLDHNGELALGNLLQQSMTEILESSRAKAIFNGFSDRKAAEELCRKCGYAQRFQK